VSPYNFVPEVRSELELPPRVEIHSATSVCSQKVRLVFAELDLGFESVVLNLQRGDQFEPGYLALNPETVVPTLVEGGRVTTQSNTIMHTHCELRRWSDPSLVSRTFPHRGAG